MRHELYHAVKAIFLQNIKNRDAKFIACYTKILSKSQCSYIEEVRKEEITAESFAYRIRYEMDAGRSSTSQRKTNTLSNNIASTYWYRKGGQYIAKAKQNHRRALPNLIHEVGIIKAMTAFFDTFTSMQMNRKQPKPQNRKHP